MIHPQYDREYADKWWETIRDFLERTLRGEEKVTDFQTPQRLKEIIKIEVDQQPCSQEHLLEEVQKVLKYQAKPYHPHFHNQLFGGFDQYSFAGAVTQPALNGENSSYELAPVLDQMQRSIFEHMRKVIGWEQIDGTMTPGGSMGNFCSTDLAKKRMFPDIDKTGMSGMPPLKIITSDVSHYSVKKGANLTGVGIENVVSVKTDQHGRMIPAELEATIKAQIESGAKPFQVNLTVGTTVEGAIDPIPECAAIAQKYGLWCHVDAAFGGARLMSPALREPLGSFADVDSITFDPHKALVAPLQAVFFMCKHKSLTTKIESSDEGEVFHQQRLVQSGDTEPSEKHILCTRVIDILKIWTYFKANGWKGIAKQVESEYNLAQYCKQYVLANPSKFKLMFTEVETFNTCFWYLPQRMKVEDFPSEADYWAQVSKITVLAKKFMMEEGKMMCGYSKSKSQYYFWRIVNSNPFLTNKDVEYELQLIGKYCEMAYDEISQQ